MYTSNPLKESTILYIGRREIILRIFWALGEKCRRCDIFVVVCSYQFHISRPIQITSHYACIAKGFGTTLCTDITCCISKINFLSLLQLCLSLKLFISCYPIKVQPVIITDNTHIWQSPKCGSPIQGCTRISGIKFKYFWSDSTESRCRHKKTIFPFHSLLSHLHL